MSRCCRTDKCQPDLDCNCPLCTEYVSVDDDHERIEMVNQHSLHLGIVTFWPLFYGIVDDASVLENLFDMGMTPTPFEPLWMKGLGKFQKMIIR